VILSLQIQIKYQKNRFWKEKSVENAVTREVIFNSSKIGYRVGLWSKEWIRGIELGKMGNICVCDDAWLQSYM
jgi:hypothetical protein